MDNILGDFLSYLPSLRILEQDILLLILWGIMGLGFMAYGIMGGIGMGVSGLLPFVVQTPEDRLFLRTFLRRPKTYGRIWLILTALLMFLTWPVLFFTTLSLFWIPIGMIVVLFMVRRFVLKTFGQQNPPFSLRNTHEDILLCVCGLVPAALFGIILGNVMVGVPFHLTEDSHAVFEGGFLDMVTPFSLTCAIISVAMMLQQGAFMLIIQLQNSENKSPQGSLIKIIHWTTLILLMTFSLIGLYSSSSLMGFKLLTSVEDLLLASSYPLINHPITAKKVIMLKGGWGMNYDLHPWMRILPAFGYLGLASAWIYMLKEDFKVAFLSNCLAVSGIIGTAGVSMYPFLLPSKTHLSSGLSLWDAPSPPLILLGLLGVIVLILPPLVRHFRHDMEDLMGENDCTNDEERVIL